MKIYVPDEEQMQALGGRLAAVCPPGCQIHLQGELGAGKTTLVRGFLRGLGYGGSVKSPTYTLVEPYEYASGRAFHFDLYRLADPEELEYIGMRDMLDEQSICLVEWPDKGAGWLPEPDLLVSIVYMESGRELEIKALTSSGSLVLEQMTGQG
jgi:tRNA threonylcarbamoyladenosine biosynthesis protein TsaE